MWEQNPIPCPQIHGGCNQNGKPKTCFIKSLVLIFEQARNSDAQFNTNQGLSTTITPEDGG